MGTQGVQIKGVLPWLVRWAPRASTRDFCPVLASLVGPVQNICFLSVHYFRSFVPIAQQVGQAVVPGRLFFYYVSLGKSLSTINSVPKFSVAENLLKPTEI